MRFPALAMIAIAMGVLIDAASHSYDPVRRAVNPAQSDAGWESGSHCNISSSISNLRGGGSKSGGRTHGLINSGICVLLIFLIVADVLSGLQLLASESCGLCRLALGHHSV